MVIPRRRAKSQKPDKAPAGVSDSTLQRVSSNLPKAADAVPPAEPDIYEPSTTVLKPTMRPLKVYAFDPSAGRFLGNYMTSTVHYEKLQPGPIGESLAVIDYDGTNKTYYTPVDLDAPNILIQGGIDPTQSDPHFHQQMVYAVATETLEHFETALGRNIRWRAPHYASGAKSTPMADDRFRLHLFPHAMRQANAFYSPEAHGILFGYFQASKTHPGRNLPGQTVFTCLSHDIIAHETTHAIVDGIREYFIEPTNVNVPAFHEAFADLSALFRHFSHSEALLDTLQKTGGLLFQFQLTPDARGATSNSAVQAQSAADNPLIQLAQQFGEASGMRAGLRGALGTANPDDINTKTEPHERGSILVAAVFDAYFTVYTRRSANLFRIFRAGGGSADPVDLPRPLAELLALEASRTADRFFTICARALDFCPPVDITFGDFLRAIITAHLDLDHEDPDGVRDAFMEAFRLRGIVASDASFFSEDALCWPKVKDKDGLPSIRGLAFGDPNGLTKVEKDKNGNLLRRYAEANAEKLGFDLRWKIDARSFHPMFRPRSDGRVDVDMMVELVQTRKADFVEGSPDLGQFPMRSGVTLSITQEQLKSGRRPAPKVRYAIRKDFSPERQNLQREYYASMGLAEGVDDKTRFHINFGLIHGGI